MKFGTDILKHRLLIAPELEVNRGFLSVCVTICMQVQLHFLISYLENPLSNSEEICPGHYLTQDIRPINRRCIWTMSV